MYVVGNWVKRNMGNISFSDCYISPREEKNSKPIPVENIVPHKRISRVIPNGGKHGGIPKTEYSGIANPKNKPSWRQTELIPRCQWKNFNKYLSWRQK